MTDDQRRGILEFLSRVAMASQFIYGSSYKFGRQEDGRLAAEGDHWLVQSERYRVNRKNGKCAGYDKKSIDPLLIEWLVAALDVKPIDDALPDGLNFEVDEEVPSYWHKEGWVESKANRRTGADD